MSRQTPLSGSQAHASPPRDTGGTFLDRPDLLPPTRGSDTLAVLEPRSQPGVEMAAIVTQQPQKSPLLLTAVKAPPAPPRSPHSCPIHTSAHYPATPATLLVTLHIPPHNPTCSFTPRSCRLPPGPSQALWITTPIQTHPHSCLDYFLRFGPALLASPCSPSPPRLLLQRHPEPSLQQKPNSCVRTGFTRRGGCPAWLLLAWASVSSVI